MEELHVDAFSGEALADAFALVEAHDVQVERIQGRNAMLETVRQTLGGTVLASDGTVWGADLRTSSKVAAGHLIVSGGGRRVRIVVG